MSFKFTALALLSDSIKIQHPNRDLVAELPFILMHPKPDDIDENIANESSTSNNNNQNRCSDKQNCSNIEDASKDDAPNLIQLDG